MEPKNNPVKESTYNALNYEEFCKVMDNLVKENERDGLLYVAGPWFTKKANKFYHSIVQIVNDVNTCYNDVYFPLIDNEQEASSVDIFNKNISKLNETKVLVALIDEKDSGTAMEIGYALAKGIPVVLVGLDETTFTCNKTNIMLAHAGIAVTLNDFIEHLRSGKFNTLCKAKENKWGNLE